MEAVLETGNYCCGTLKKNNIPFKEFKSKKSWDYVKATGVDSDMFRGIIFLPTITTIIFSKIGNLPPSFYLNFPPPSI